MDSGAWLGPAAEIAEVLELRVHST
jgi:hypothetical protein